MSRARKLFSGFQKVQASFSSLSKTQLVGVTSVMGTAGLFGVSYFKRYFDKVNGQSRFSQHTNTQHQKNLLSGLHEPLIPSDDQLSFFKEHFAEYLHLLPTDLEAFQEKQASKTPVKIRPLSECEQIVECKGVDALFVGGAPALVPAAFIAKEHKNVVYLNDDSGASIAKGAAMHIEEDGFTEAPTSNQPLKFISNQIKRATMGYVDLTSIEETGFTPWSTLDWMGWLTTPSQWAAGLKVAFNFQIETMASPEKRKETLKKVSEQCKNNEKFYINLNKEVGGSLLLPGQGSIYVARNAEEAKELLDMKKYLEQEGREVKIFSKEEMEKRYGYVPQGVLFCEKTHDRALSPNFMSILKGHIQKQGGTVLNGKLTTLYTDNQHEGGIAEYQTPDGQKKFIPFSKVLMSLGNQQVLDVKDKPLFDVVSARGVSMLGYLDVPKGHKPPLVKVCGGTNHVTRLSDKPVSIQDEKGQTRDRYLLRMTAGACITPNVSEKNAVNYDGSIAVGLVTATQKTLGPQCTVTPITAYGCNRVVSQYGQTQTVSPAKGVFIQYGAGGGGLTRAPDFAVNQYSESFKSRCR